MSKPSSSAFRSIWFRKKDSNMERRWPHG